MSEDEGLVALEYLLGASKTSLENATLNAMADERNRRKEIIDLIESWAERKAQLLLFEWFRKHGETLVGSVTREVVVTELQRLSEPEKPGPQTSEDFRESLRKLVKSA